MALSTGKRVLVPFEGDGAGIADLSWGQQSIWHQMCRQRSSMTLGGVFPLTPGTTLDDITAELSFLLSRHQSLRTRLRPGPDGQVGQEIFQSGELPLDIVDTMDAAGAADGIADRFLNTVYEYTGEWPVRAAVVTRDGLPAFLAFAVCHIAVDGIGLMMMCQELVGRPREIGFATGLAAMLDGTPQAATDPPGQAPPGPAPAEQARWQSGPEGKRVSDAAMRHYERILRKVPVRGPHPRPARRQPHYWQVRGDSPACYLAARAVATRLGLTTAPVLLAGYAVALARVTGVNPVLTHLVINNRFRPGLSGTVSPIAQPSLAVIDVADVTFDEAVKRAWRASLAASKHSYHEPARLRELAAGLGHQRGEPLDTECFFNDRRLLLVPEVIDRVASPAEVKAALGRTTMRWDPPMSRPGEGFFVHLKDGDATIAYTLCLDTGYISPDSAQAWLHEMETLLVRAAFDPAVPTSV